MGENGELTDRVAEQSLMTALNAFQAYLEGKDGQENCSRVPSDLYNEIESATTLFPRNWDNERPLNAGAVWSEEQVCDLSSASWKYGHGDLLEGAGNYFGDVHWKAKKPLLSAYPGQLPVTDSGYLNSIYLRTYDFMTHFKYQDQFSFF